MPKTDYSVLVPGLTTPEGALDELRTMIRLWESPRACQYALERFSSIQPRLFPATPPDVYAYGLAVLPKVLRLCSPYLWSSELWRIGNISAASYPYEGQVWGPDLFDQPCMYWAMQRDVTLVNPELAQEGLTHMMSVMYAYSGRDACMTVFLTDDSSDIGMFLPLFQYIRMDDPITEEQAPAAGKLAFLQSTLISRSAAPAQRSARRRWEKALNIPSPDIRTVTLRRHRVLSERLGDNPVDWAYRWMVRGHWRRQAHGKGRQERRPIWIAPHVKGPEDKPLKPPSEIVFAVTR